MNRTNSKSGYSPIRELVLFVASIALLYVIMAASNTWKPLLGLDLQGGTSVTLTAKSTSGAVSPDSLEQARQVIEKRVDGIGVSEATVTTQAGNQIVVTAPGFNQDALVEQVGKTAQLEFRQVHQAEPLMPVDPNAPVGLPTAPPGPPPARPASTGEKLGIDAILAWTPTEQEQTEFHSYECGNPTTSNLDQALITCNEDGTEKYLLGPVAISGESIENAAAQAPHQGGSLTYEVALQLKDDAKGDFSTLTAAAVAQTGTPKNRFAIVLDDLVVSAPGVNSQIDNGQASITGGFTKDTANYLANVLRYGALPLSFESSDVQNVSATLGGEQLQGGLIAAVIGLILVMGFSIFYYKGLSIIVAGSLAAAGLLTYAMLALLGTSMGVVLTLPGLAGAVVSIGTTADSFIIYYERMRDEIRDGKSLKAAIETGWQKARGTIVVSDGVQLLSAVVLFFLAAGNVQGFAFILAMTTIMDLIIVFYFTHPVMTLLGRTKFFGHGHKYSGLSPESMGVSRNSLLGKRARITRKSLKKVMA